MIPQSPAPASSPAVFTLRLAALGAAVLLPLPVFAQEAPVKELPFLPTVDVRVNGAPPAESLRGLRANELTNKKAKLKASLGKALAQFKSTSPGAEAKISAHTGGVELLRSNGFLTGPAAPGQSGADIVLDFFSENRALFGLE